MSYGEFFGYIASALVFATFYMRTMLPLRIVAIASNVAFITYALIDGLTPILILHGALLPLNLLRLLQIRDLTVQVEKAATHEFSAQAILPFMRRRNLRANEVLFSANDVAEELYYVLEGELFIPEVQQAVGPGSFVGEFALFSTSGRRTATAIARTDCTVMLLGKKAVFAALLHSPQLGIHLLRVITIRMLENAGIRDQQLIPVDASEPRRVPDRFIDRFGRRTTIAVLVVLGVIPVVVAVYQPLYIVLDRDASVTSWLNEATAPIAGTIEGFETRIGQQVDQTGVVATLVDRNADRSGVIKAEVRYAEPKHGSFKSASIAIRWQDWPRNGRIGEPATRMASVVTWIWISRIWSSGCRS